MTTELSEQIEQHLEATSEPAMSHVVVQDATHILIDDRRYLVVTNQKDGFDPERLNERYHDILAKYDYIVGDWGYDQLRLRGFYKPSRKNANRDQLISHLADYLYEYCNFGCAYFVLQAQDKPVREASRPAPANKRKRRPRKPSQPGQAKQATTVNQSKRKRHFTIRTQTETK